MNDKIILHYKHLAFFYCRKDKSALQITNKICSVYGENSVTELTVRKWCAEFKSHDFKLEYLGSHSSKVSKYQQVHKYDDTQNSNKARNLLKYPEINIKTRQPNVSKDKANLVDDIINANTIKPVCEWLTKDPLYIKYHDEEWGNPEYGSIKLFEMICLEGQQAGLSWLTILKKREQYRKLFYHFDPYKVAQLNSNNIDKYLLDPGIIRHRSKIEAIVNNAKCYINMANNQENFSKFIWGFVNNSPIINYWKNNSDVPIQTEVSIALSQALKKRGFKFVGPTTCYAFMQACGLVNDHITSCYSRIKK